MKGVWQCNRVKGSPNLDGWARAVTCRRWNVHYGHRARPLRIDVRCTRCDARHQHRPHARDARGRQGRIRYVKFPDDVDLQTLVDFTARRNQAQGRQATLFVPASEFRSSPSG